MTVPQRRSNKAFWFTLHGWFALPIWGLLTFVCITGTLCSVSEEITWLFSAEVRATNPYPETQVSYSALIKSVEAHYPGAMVKAIQISQPYLASRVRISLPAGELKNVYVNQYTHNIQGEASGIGFRAFMLGLHGWLLFPWEDNYSLGWYLVTMLAIPLLGSIISGLIIFKHFYRLLFKPVVRLNSGRRVFWGDLHRLIAAWSIWFVLIISISGCWFLVQGILDQNNVKMYPDKVQLTAENVAVTDNNYNVKTEVDQIAENAQSTFPTLQITYIEFPENEMDTLMIQGRKQFSLLRDSAYVINVNPYNGAAVSIRSPDELSLLQFMPALLMPLHFGDFAGLTSKIIWFFFGCLLSVLVASGFISWWLRTFTGTKQKSTIPSSSMQTRKSYFLTFEFSFGSLKISKLTLFLISWIILIFPVYFFIEMVRV